MNRWHILRLLLCLSALGFPAAARAADPPAVTAPARKTFVATGPTSEADLARLKAALARVAGVMRVELRPQADGAIVLIEGETSSVLSAAARTAGFTLRPTPTRAFSAKGPNADADLARLRDLLKGIEGVEQVEIGPIAGGAALRVTGITPSAQMAAAAKGAGFTLRQLAAYAAAGPSAPADLQRLRTALGKAQGVEEIEAHPLTGGATLLVFGDVTEARLVAAGKTVGFDVWPLSAGSPPREFKIAGPAGENERRKLQDLLKAMEGIGEIAFRATPDGARVTVDGGRVRPDRIVDAAHEAGIELTSLEPALTLPDATPQAGRGTPPDFDERVLDDQAKPGEAAPDFDLVAADGVTHVRLSDFRGKRPVILMFGSCT
jgi:copper chaperone CopZ